MSRVLLLLSKFARMKRLENFWGHPIWAGYDSTPFCGRQLEWEWPSKIRVTGDDMSNNLLNHILARSKSAADVIMSFDTSSDVQTGSVIRLMHNFPKYCNVHAPIKSLKTPCLPESGYTEMWGEWTLPGQYLCSVTILFLDGCKLRKLSSVINTIRRGSLHEVDVRGA